MARGPALFDSRRKSHHSTFPRVATSFTCSPFFSPFSVDLILTCSLAMMMRSKHWSSKFYIEISRIKIKTSISSYCGPEEVSSASRIFINSYGTSTEFIYVLKGVEKSKHGVGCRNIDPPMLFFLFFFCCEFQSGHQLPSFQSPCEHIFCLECARSDSLCYLCDERIQKIQTIRKLEGVFVCAAPHCLKSFLNKTEFESHIHEVHSDLIHAEKDGNISESASARKPAASESTVPAPPRPVFSPSSGSQVHDREDNALNSQTRDQQPPRPLLQQKPSFTGSVQNHPLEQESNSNPPQGFERPGMQSWLPKQSFDAQGSLQSDPVHFPDKQQGIMGSSPFPEYPMHMPQPHGFAVPMSSNQTLAPQFGYSQFAPDGTQPFYGAASVEMPRPESTHERGSEQGSLLGFPPGAAGNMNFPENYPRPWNMGHLAGPFDPAAVQHPPDGFVNAADPRGRAVFFQGDHGRNASVMPSNLPPPPSANRGLEDGQSSNSKDTRDSKGILMPQPMSLPPPPPLPHHMSRFQRGGRHYSGDRSHDGQGYGWQHEKRDNFGSSQD